MTMCFAFKDLLISANFSGALTRSPGSGTGAGLANRLLKFPLLFQRFLICSIRLAVDFRKELKGKKTFTVSTTQHANIFWFVSTKKDKHYQWIWLTQIHRNRGKIFANVGL